MGYHTEFSGRIGIGPPLNEHEVAYLKRFADSRRWNRPSGPYACGDDDLREWPRDDESRDRYNRPPEGQPGLWCSWTPTDDGTAIEWDGSEKFSNSVEWMRYLITQFLSHDAALQWETPEWEREPWSDQLDRHHAPEFQHFTYDHVLNGMVNAQGEEDDDAWRLMVVENAVAKVPREPIPEEVLLQDAREVALLCLNMFRGAPTGLDELFGAETWAMLPDWFTDESNGRLLWNGGEE